MNIIQRVSTSGNIIAKKIAVATAPVLLENTVNIVVAKRTKDKIKIVSAELSCIRPEEAAVKTVISMVN